MERITLANTSLETSRIGFGCVSLTTHNDSKSAYRILEEAFDSGITHFDTARAYGMGLSERMLGEFIRDKRNQVTITTKFGIDPQFPFAIKGGFVRSVKKILRRVPAVDRLVRRRAQSFVKAGVFDPSRAAASLETSLRELKTDRIDILLLHEATIGDANKEDLMGFLEGEISRGTARHVGIGSDYRHFGADVSQVPSSYSVLQFASNPLSPSTRTLRGLQTRDIITHSAIVPLPRVRDAARAAPEVTRRFSDRLDADLSDVRALSRLLLRYALAMNRDGIVLFATTSSEHLRANVDDASVPPETADWVEAVDAFITALGLHPDHARAVAQTDDR
jgi:D-threo-aldose 1-dehydrogenase